MAKAMFLEPPPATAEGPPTMGVVGNEGWGVSRTAGEMGVLPIPIPRIIFSWWTVCIPVLALSGIDGWEVERSLGAPKGVPNFGGRMFPFERDPLS
jgi:hypothetical protein